jgi:hypothetical protein
MKMLEDFLNQLSSIIWGPVMLAFLLGIGIFFKLGIKSLSLAADPECIQITVGKSSITATR